MPIVSILSELSHRPNFLLEAPPRIFCIEEILLQILSFLSIGDIYHFALTNRTVVDAALDQVWSQLTNLTPLFKLLPSEIIDWGGLGSWHSMVC